MEELNPELFTDELYESNYLSRLGAGVFYNDLDAEVKNHMIGWCSSELVCVPPNGDYIAVMCEDGNGDRFWFHYSRGILD